MPRRYRKRSPIFRALVWLFWRLVFIRGQPADHSSKAWKRWYWKVHLRSWYWARVRRIVLKRDGHMCQGERCWAKSDLDIHHKRYTYVGRELEKPEYLTTLTTLCRDCHNRTHEELRSERTRSKIRAAKKRAA